MRRGRADDHDTVRSHVVLAPDCELRCYGCDHRASRFMVCRVCRRIVASCQNHNLTIEEERDRHCQPSHGAP